MSYNQLVICTGHNTHIPDLQNVIIHLTLWRQWIPLDGLMQERRNPAANALALRLSCTNPSIYACILWFSNMTRSIICPLHSRPVDSSIITNRIIRNTRNLKNWGRPTGLKRVPWPEYIALGIGNSWKLFFRRLVGLQGVLNNITSFNLHTT